jgi:hypothetical protein
MKLDAADLQGKWNIDNSGLYFTFEGNNVLWERKGFDSYVTGFYIEENSRGIILTMGNGIEYTFDTQMNLGISFWIIENNGSARPIIFYKDGPADPSIPT